MLQLQIVSFRKGSYLVVEGKENTDHFYIIQKGNVQCMKSSGSGLAPTMYGPGDFVGVVPCMSDHLQIETAIATTDVMAISVRKDQYPELISQNTPVALKIIKTFANRMRVMNEMLTKATLHSVVQDTYEQIFKVASFYEQNALPDVAVFAYYQYLKTKPQGPNADLAKQKFVALKPKTHAVYFEPTAEPSRQYPKDTMIFSEAQSGSDMFIIQRGEVSITKVVNGNEVTLAVLKKGDMFGEMALIENKPRSANALAHSDCTLMVINRSNFNQMVATQPQLVAKLTTTLADRLWSMYRQLDNAALHEPLAKMLDMLSLQLEKQRVKLGLSKVSMQTEFTPKDLANMCGIENQNQPKAIYDFENYNQIRIENGKIFIKDAQEVMKAAAFYRKQNK
ncbi:cAMP-binding domain of CRP or a regulatory subunit of cAMP-dependent protein kinases [Treponema bryantii]|uniref:cAMP-binding domain of CRP or a regulatory subunit of cAMP-dependent protein kinases n=1 Tax=Treponema bryantii TaxID=163 RepID=A0A1I3L6V0_9SPIR|nr:cyclic nucleotide-binding domain-containing protein [Treponema bryantii]SFI80155.1 cAMP-binding domain of CRP or a regulatory subunit of cAMP-dependent protein kinases [Treponema bryantii]